MISLVISIMKIRHSHLHKQRIVYVVPPIRPKWGSPRQSWILDSTPWILDSRCWIQVLCQWNLDSGFRELYSEFQSPRFQISHEKFQDSRIWFPLHAATNHRERSIHRRNHRSEKSLRLCWRIFMKIIVSATILSPQQIAQNQIRLNLCDLLRQQNSVAETKICTWIHQHTKRFVAATCCPTYRPAGLHTRSDLSCVPMLKFAQKWPTSIFSPQHQHVIKRKGYENW